jgi:hypothetical protein
VIRPVAQVSGTRTEVRQAPRRRRPRRRLEIAGLVIGLVAGLGIAFGWLIPTLRHPAAAAPAVYRPPVVVRGASAAPNPAALEAEWVSYSDHSGCADWAGGDGISAIRLNSSQLAWFFSDTYLGPAGPSIGFSQISGFVNNAVVVQTTTLLGSGFVSMTGGRACDRPDGPGNALAVVAAPAAPGSPSDRYWDEDGIKIGGSVVKFYNRYLAGSVPFIPAGTVMAVFPVSQLSAAGYGSRYGEVAQPHVVPLSSYTPPGDASPILWGAAVLRAGNTIYVYGTQGPNAPAQDRLLYLARVRASELTNFSAWRFYTGAGRWSSEQQNAEPVQPPGSALSVSSGFSVVKIGRRYWLIQAGAVAGSQDIDAYPAKAPSGPFDPAAGIVLYRNPAIGLDAAHDYRIMYEARVEPALSTSHTLVISYNVNSEAVTSACVPMSHYTNRVTLPQFIAVPSAAFGAGPDRHPATSAAPNYPRIVQRDPSQWFDAWGYPEGCPPAPGLASVRARPGTGKVTLSWPDAGLGVRYQIYLRGARDAGAIPAKTTYSRHVTIRGLQPGQYQATVVPVNFKHLTGAAAAVTFTVP